MTTIPAQDARIRELMLVNLFAVFSERDPERRMKAITANYTEDVIWSNPEATSRGREIPPVLAMSLRPGDLSLRLGDLGRREEALAASAEATGI